MKKLISSIYDDFYPFIELLPQQDAPVRDSLLASANPLDVTPDSVLLLWGGGDISPSFYGAKRASRGGGDDTPNRRDRIEWAMLQRAIEVGAGIIGICRGAQMLCAAAGGKLMQHVDNHAGYGHTITTIEGETLHVNSLHHQMMYPFEVDHELLAWSSEKRSGEYHDENMVYTDIPCEPELVYFPKIKGIGAQWHPEMMKHDAPATQYLLNKIKETLHV